ncbi:MAG: SDR family oxidoreductase [Gemmatimonadetes bacterium]|nr:SDR family oxidoreductase [Gemmatimonadota bacterium]MYB07656.1 SDR family oxidoreductase [Gemmatimonadota bacterium]MYE15518.1 SDR family oxidoreductase [Gemmatimonadota bacterium]MYG20867.1 SDR family oxidoreductase [Gemmatimonadota bacterium]MYJ39996.1 SDR family oxidoreductase [Gemmatimonadota bacterium]
MTGLNLQLAGKRALVTGGSRGVGAATVRLLARAGADVGISYHSRADDARRVVEEARAMGVRSWAVGGNLAERGAADALFERVDTEFGGLDIFVGNAGIWPVADVPFAEMDDEQWHRTVAVNLDSIFFTTRAALQRMSDDGRVILVSSTAGQRGEAYHGDYAATKGAIISMVKGLCVEVGRRGITVNAVAPGWIDTEMSEAALQGPDRAAIDAAIPLGRVASADDVAGPIVLLCSPLARHITGEIVNVNGGSVLVG